MTNIAIIDMLPSLSLDEVKAMDIVDKRTILLYLEIKAQKEKQAAEAESNRANKTEFDKLKERQYGTKRR